MHAQTPWQQFMPEAAGLTRLHPFPTTLCHPIRRQQPIGVEGAGGASLLIA